MRLTAIVLSACFVFGVAVPEYVSAASSCQSINKKFWSESSIFWNNCGGVKYKRKPQQCLSMTNNARQTAEILRVKCGVAMRGDLSNNWKDLYNAYIVISDYISDRNGGGRPSYQYQAPTFPLCISPTGMPLICGTNTPHPNPVP